MNEPWHGDAMRYEGGDGETMARALSAVESFSKALEAMGSATERAAKSIETAFAGVDVELLLAPRWRSRRKRLVFVPARESDT